MSKVKAYHIVGGDFTAEWAGGNDFEVTLKLFRDCAAINGSGFDQAINIAVYDKVTHIQQQYFVMYLGGVSSLQYAGNLCSPPPQVCVEEGTYIQTVTLPNNPNGYYLIWERCCRNSNVVNLSNPNAAAMAFYLEIADPALQNSTPVFLNDPLPYMCLNQPFNFNFLGYDMDGDSISFAFETPLDGGHTSQSSPNPFSFNGPGAGNLIPPAAPYAFTNWLAGYSTSNIINGNPTLSINPINGQMYAVPTNTGLYAMAVVMYEWRQGVNIGKVRREIEFVVINCNGNVVPNILTSLSQTSSNTFIVNADDTLSFSITASDVKDSLYITHSGNVFAGSGITPPYAISFDTAGLKQVTTQFFWIPSCNHVSASPYTLTYTVTDNGCPLPASKTFDISILVVPQQAIVPPALLCIEKDMPIPVLHWADTISYNPHFDKAIIYRSTNGAAYYPIDTLYQQQNNTYTDSSANQFQYNYCYYISLFNKCETSITYSDTLCTQQQFNGDVININQVSVSAQNKITIQWPSFAKAAFNTILIYKKETTDTTYYLWKTLPNYLPDSISDSEVNTNAHSYSYIITNKNTCNIPANFGDEGCTILLKGDAIPYRHTIYFTPYRGWLSVKHYEIYRKDDHNRNYQLLNTQNDTSFIDDQLPLLGGQFTYLIKAIADGKPAYSYSNEITLLQQPTVFLPNAFSPNDDTVNDVWKPAVSFVNTFKLLVYNRWGDLVFSAANELSGWNGFSNSKPCDAGIYLYKLLYTGFKGDAYEKTGTITLVK
ncbi:MAG: gliding motility-associated C-terminal domain-containing protein [Bacteroidia bacterium]|nr:gliding motility-associated C-terminal domain-containing protein [Bacteroidia bacterium]HQU99693.1 gliding motility-associated C-terminal domain-containing protein [Bacteroidia bacterium]